MKNNRFLKHNIPTFDINLDLPVEKRFTHILEWFDFRYIQEAIHDLFKEYCPKVPFIDGMLEWFVDINKEKIQYRDEIEFWSQTFNIPFHKAVVMQLLYEINSACTTFVCNLEGKNVMIRTFDWPDELIKHLLFQGVYYRGKKKIYEAVSILGAVGIFTGKSCLDGYSIAINHRTTTTNLWYGAVKNFSNIYNRHIPVSYLVREVLESGYDCAKAIDTLKNRKIISPVYYIVNRFNDTPMIIQRDPTNHKIICDKFVIQSNCDVEEMESYLQNKKSNLTELDITDSVARYTQTKRVLQKHTTLDKVLKCIWRKPVLRWDTLFISIINNDEFRTHIH